MSWIIYTTNQNWPNLSYRDWSHFLPELQIWVGLIPKMMILSSEMSLVSDLTIFGNFWQFHEISFHILGDVTKFLQGHHADHCMIGVQLLSQLTCEMNQVRFSRNITRDFTKFHEISRNFSRYFIFLQISEADANRSLTKHRKIASSFR